MDKQFWISIQQNDYQIPEGHSVSDLKEELFSYLGSTDPELRDTVGLEVFWNWLSEGIYSLDDLHALVPRLTANLQQGIGEIQSDSVFLRSFSNLWLACIVDVDNKNPQLSEEEILSILKAALAYLPAERDLRGLVPLKGWAHGIAHAADLFWRLASSPHLNANHHAQILDCIATTLNNSTAMAYIYSEDCRLARAVIEIFKQDTLSLEEIQAWLANLSSSWNGAWASEETALSFFNARNFLRCLHWRMDITEDISNKQAIMDLLHEALDQARPWAAPD